ncbi:hypothetical protein OAD28_09745 [Flavobacteriales bacterium]|jgi:hypothetical protein|nr:hypothetical protein [Flavobacteriales bacterium]
MKIIISFLCITLVFCSCNKELEEETPVTPTTSNTSLISFNSDVLTIFNTYCNGSYCHGGGADGKYFDTHANVVLVPSSTLLGAINHTTGYEPMPKSQPKLRQGEIDTITTWINDGRLDN